MAAPLAPGEIPTAILTTLGHGSCLTIDQLDTALPLNRRQISDGAAKLILRGLAERVEAGCYQLTSAGLEAAARGEAITSGPMGRHTAKARKPIADTLRQRAWTAMRMSGAFTVGALVMAAGRGEADAENNLQRYLRRLKGAGYVAELPVRERGTALTSNGFKRYRLIRDTGPAAPVWSDARGRIIEHNGDSAC